MSALRPPRPPRDEDESTGRHVEPAADGDSDAVYEEDMSGVAEVPARPAESLGQGDEQKRFPCAQCGADLAFKPGTADLVCEYCGHANHIPQSAEDIRELDFRTHLALLADGEPTYEQTTAKCETCAAEVEPPPNVTAFACPFCGSNIVAQGKSKRLIKPRSLLP
ncbi:MAG: hypothetical protein JXO22_05055, partial [Phycisphaerae bacterium]|nr:hypothetical protein [Phycisphaerae bacterium]